MALQYNPITKKYENTPYSSLNTFSPSDNTLDASNIAPSNLGGVGALGMDAKTLNVGSDGSIPQNQITGMFDSLGSNEQRKQNSQLAMNHFNNINQGSFSNQGEPLTARDTALNNSLASFGNVGNSQWKPSTTSVINNTTNGSTPLVDPQSFIDRRF